VSGGETAPYPQAGEALFGFQIFFFSAGSIFRQLPKGVFPKGVFPKGVRRFCVQKRLTPLGKKRLTPLGQDQSLLGNFWVRIPRLTVPSERGKLLRFPDSFNSLQLNKL